MTASSTFQSERPYIGRIIDAELDVLLGGLGAISIEGAKAVGKTATAVRRAARTLRLDRPAVADAVRAAPEEALRGPFPVFIDEWQHVPTIWDAVREFVDNDPTPGRVLLAGSAAPVATARPTHTGAGRIVTRRMRPLAISERLTEATLSPTARDTVSIRALLTSKPSALRGASPWTLSDYAREIIRSGFPGIRQLDPVLRRAQLDGYVHHLTTRDVQEANGAAANPAAVQRWLLAFAAATATTTSLEKLRDIATAGDGGLSAKTTALRYRDALERLFIYDPLPAWQPVGTALSRLGGAPKIHLVDPALSAHLLGIDEEALMDGVTTPLVDAIPSVRDGGLFGALFESLVTLSMRTYAQAADVQFRYLRTHGGGHEVDGILVRRDQKCVAFEVKLAGTIDDRDVRHLHWLKDQLGDQLLDAIVISTGPAAYRRGDGIGVVPAALLVP